MVPAQSSDHAPVRRVAARVDISMRMVSAFSQRVALLRLWDEDELSMLQVWQLR